MKPVFRFKQDFNRDGIRLLFGMKDGRDFYEADPVKVTFHKLELGEGEGEPFFTLNTEMCNTSPRDIALALIQAVRDMGYSDLLYSAKDGEVEAIKAHLEDMRKITFDTLPVILKK